MAKSINYVEAKKDYGIVKYFPFNSTPADSFVLTADPWNYLIGWLETEIKKLNGKKNRHQVRTRLNKALYFTKLAQNFELSAKALFLPIKALPMYYSALNLVKAFLLVKGIDLETKIETHGVSLRPNEKDKLHIGKASKNDYLNIFLEFAQIMRVQGLASQEIKLNDILSQLPEIHELAHSLKKITGKRNFLPIDLRIMTDENSGKKLAYEIEIDKRHSQRYDLSKLSKGVLGQKLVQIQSEQDSSRILFRSQSTFNYSSSSDLSWNRNYLKVCDEIQSLNVVTMLSRVGYRYYLNLQSQNFGQPLNYFLLLFYMGSVARYRPSLVEEYLQGEYQSIFNEVLNTSPKQFLYHMASLITNKVCAVPMAKID